jgi:hypothetical protein
VSTAAFGRHAHHAAKRKLVNDGKQPINPQRQFQQSRGLLQLVAPPYSKRDLLQPQRPIDWQGIDDPLLSTSVWSRTSFLRWDSERGAFNCTSTLFADRAMS